MDYAWIIIEDLDFTKRGMKVLRYSDICDAFYITEEKKNGESELIGIGLKSATSQADIGLYFFEVGCDEKYQALLDTYNPSSFNKWFSGKTGQRKEVWARFTDQRFSEEDYARQLQSNLNDEVLPLVAQKLEIRVRKGEEINKNRLAVAITRQMLELAKSKGTTKNATNIIPDLYDAGKIESDFSNYISLSEERYNVMKLLGGDEVSLEKYFVCNTIGEKQRVVTDKTPPKCVYIEDATIQSIRDMFQTKQKYDNLKSILIGCGGSGKTLMLQHLFLDGMKKFEKTGILPIFLELRYFALSDDIESFILKNVSSKDESFTEDICRQMLLDGKCVILMDGLDEIDPTGINDFHMKLNAFTNSYNRVQIILASRECDSIKGLNLFKSLYVWPFDEIQRGKLVDKILEANGEEEQKDRIMAYINDGFIEKDGAFSSHPMLLTFVAMNYPQYASFSDKPLLFYEKAYAALLTGHDDNKKPYDRVFHSVDNPDQFSKVFREFCGKSYKDGKSSFDDSSFLAYFESLTSYKSFESTSKTKMTLKHFKHDVCSTACMMYEKDLGIWYIDPGFQEFLFAEYYATADVEETKELGQILRGKSYGDFEKLSAFEMLYESKPEKVDVCIFLPFLDDIFRNNFTEEDAFRAFLVECYEKIEISYKNRELIEKYKKHYREIVGSYINVPTTVLLDWLGKQLEANIEFEIPEYVHDSDWDQYISGLIAGMYVDMPDAGLNIPTKDILALRRYPQMQFLDKEKTTMESSSILNNTESLIKNENGEIVCFGYEYEIDTLDIEEEPERFQSLITEMMTHNSDVYITFKALRDYHKKLKREQRRNRLR